MTAWQHPVDSCPACGQDVLLRPEVTPDVHMVYVRYCPRCDAGEPIVASRDGAVPSWVTDPDELWGPAPQDPPHSWLNDRDAFWTTTGVGSRPAYHRRTATAAAVAASVTAAPSRRRRGRRRSGVELWWNGDADGAPGAEGSDGAADAGPEPARTRIDQRWAAFAANDAVDEDDDNEMPMAAEGSFSFGVEDIGRRRRARFARPRRLRQSA